MKRTIRLLLSIVVAASLLGPSPKAEGNSDKLSTIKTASLEVLEQIVSSGKRKLQGFSSASSVDSSMEELQDVVLAAAERARRLSEWDVERAQKEAEATFDQTIKAIEEYLALVADEGDVHKAAKRVRAAALERGRAFREKGNAKNSNRYLDLAKEMDLQAKNVSEIWDAICTERDGVAKGLKELRESREFYVDLKVAGEVQRAVKELSRVRDDLRALAASMAGVQRAILGGNAKPGVSLVSPN